MATFNSTSLIVDDADPKITYSPGWALDNSGVTPGFNHTLHIANATGQWASFNFTGVSVAVYGDYGVNAFQFTLSSYAIDGTKVGTYQPPINMSIETSDLLANNVVFYQSPPLTQGTHVLNITINQAAPAGLFYLDYIVFTPGSPTSSQSQPTSSGSASTPVFSAVAPSSVTTVTATASPSSKSHVGAIVGGVIGGVVALVLIVVFGYYCYRRKMMRPSLDSKLEIEPYIQAPRHAGDGTRWLDSNTHVNTESLPAQGLQSYPVSDASSDFPEKSSISKTKKRPGHMRSVTSETASSSATTATTATTQSETTSHSFVTLQHNDSGIRLPPVLEQAIPEVPVPELPPAYTRN